MYVARRAWRLSQAVRYLPRRSRAPHRFLTLTLTLTLTLILTLTLTLTLALTLTLTLG